MATTAEGVETEEQLRELLAGSCTDAQGYLFSPPRPEMEIPRLRREIEARLAPGDGSVPEGGGRGAPVRLPRGAEATAPYRAFPRNAPEAELREPHGA
jgi:hypothetical protein